jgi:F1F0 ATPase subunit 2
MDAPAVAEPAREETIVSTTLLLHALLGLAAGMALGLAHFASLAWNTRLYVKGGAARALTVQLLRLALLALAFAWLARSGALPLLAGALGLLLARRLVLRRLGAVP